MKKFAIAFVAAVSLLGLAACNDNKDAGGAPSNTPATPSPTAPGTGGSGSAPAN
ncbi:MAG: hypothetical protein J0H18_03830 [Rhizobiales bacterium]|nr:hypothetical protein [Hyphomicrobiales bacterium]